MSYHFRDSVRRVVLLSAIVILATAYRAPNDTRPNIIVYLPDSVRAESLAQYGHPLIATPNVGRLAAAGTLFESCHVQHTQCSPSRAAIITGRYMHVLGHRTQTHLVQPSEPNLFAILKKSGYTTLLLGKNDALVEASFAPSLTYWQDVIGEPSGANAFPWGTAGYYSFLSRGGGEANTTQDRHAVELVADWLSDNPPEPFAVLIAGDGSHPPYGAPAPYQTMYSPAAVEAAAPLRPFIPGKPPHIGPNGITSFRNLTSLPNSTFYEVAAVYLGRVSYVDSLLGVLLDGISAAPASLRNNTALFFTSDHGDYSGDWRCVEKLPCALDDVLTRVPLVAMVPGGVAGSRVTSPVESLDLFATILDMAHVNLSAIDRHFSRSLVPSLIGHPQTDWKRFVYSEGGYTAGTIEVEPLDPAQRSAYDDPKGLYWPRGQEELVPGHCPRAVMQVRCVSERRMLVDCDAIACCTIPPLPLCLPTFDAITPMCSEMQQ